MLEEEGSCNVCIFMAELHFRSDEETDNNTTTFSHHVEYHIPIAGKDHRQLCGKLAFLRCEANEGQDSRLTCRAQNVLSQAVRGNSQMVWEPPGKGKGGLEANTLNDEIVFVKKRNDKLQRSVIKMEEQRCRLGRSRTLIQAFASNHAQDFASWSIMARGSNNFFETINIHNDQIQLQSFLKQ